MVVAASGEVEHGEAFTRRWVVEAVIDLAEWPSDDDLTALALVEPSVGSGPFPGHAEEDLNERFPGLEQVDGGTRISVGVATGEDIAYVVDREPDVESDRLLSPVMGHGIRFGGLVDIARHPSSEQALEGLPAVVVIASKPGQGVTREVLDPSFDGLEYAVGERLREIQVPAGTAPARSWGAQ